MRAQIERRARRRRRSRRSARERLLDEGAEARRRRIEDGRIFGRIRAADERMVKTLQHRERNREFIEFYSGMFQDVEW